MATILRFPNLRTNSFFFWYDKVIERNFKLIDGDKTTDAINKDGKIVGYFHHSCGVGWLNHK